MDVLQVELAKLRRDANLSQSIQDVDSIIEQLERAREAIVAGERPEMLGLTDRPASLEDTAKPAQIRTLPVARSLNYRIPLRAGSTKSTMISRRFTKGTAIMGRR